MTIGTCSTETCHWVCHWDVNLYTGATPLCAEVAGRARNPEWHMTWKQRRTQDDPKRFFPSKISTPQCRYVYSIYIYICIHTRKPGRSPTLKHTPYTVSCLFGRTVFWLLDAFLFTFLGIDYVGTYLKHVRILKAFVFKVLWNGLPQYKLCTCPNLC